MSPRARGRSNTALIPTVHSLTSTTMFYTTYDTIHDDDDCSSRQCISLQSTALPVQRPRSCI